jgi:V/A-type H+-transporting ATPase subunit K
MPTIRFALGATAVAAALSIAATALLAVSGSAGAQAPAGAGIASEWGLLAAALATGLSSLGAGYAVAHLGAAGVGALAEKPELFGRLLVFVGLAEGIAIYGVIISILILNRLA